MRRIWAVVMAVATLTVLIWLPGPAQGVAPTLTRIEFDIITNSEFARAEILNGRILAQRVVATTPAAQVTRGGNAVAVKGSIPAGVVMTAILEVPQGSNPVLRVTKGYSGEARVKITRLNGARTLLVNMVNRRKERDYSTSAPLTREALVGEGLAIPEIDGRNLTLAAYYPWWNSQTFTRDKWWDTPASHFNTEDPGAVRGMINEAGQAGVDGFVTSWVSVGPDANSGRVGTLLQAAATRPGFVVAPYLETKVLTERYGAGPGPVLQSLRYFFDISRGHNILRVGTRPVIFAYATRYLTPSDWQWLRAQLVSSGINPFIMGDMSSPDYRPHFDGLYRYNPNDYDIEQLRSVNIGLAHTARLDSQLDPAYGQRLWAATVSPGMNDMYFRGRFGGGRSVNRDEGRRYDATWQAALDSSPEWVMITSWNEWYESTHISPGVRTGARALNQTAGWTTRFG